MSEGAAQVVKGVPALLGVMAGVILFSKGEFPDYFFPPLALLSFLFLLLFLSYWLVLKLPRISLFLIEIWGISAVCIVAISTEFIFWITINAGKWFVLEKPELDAVSGALVGAITTYLATIWTDDIKNANSPFLASFQFKKLLGDRFSPHYKLKGDCIEVEACHYENVRGDTSGWGLRARWKRAAIVSRYVQ